MDKYVKDNFRLFFSSIGVSAITAALLVFFFFPETSNFLETTFYMTVIIIMLVLVFGAIVSSISGVFGSKRGYSINTDDPQEVIITRAANPEHPQLKKVDADLLVSEHKKQQKKTEEVAS